MSTILADREEAEQIREEAKQASDRLKLLGLFPLLLFGLLLNAYLFLLMWHWFIMPLGVRDITYWHSAGLSVMFSYLRGSQLQSKESRGYREWLEIIKTGFREVTFFFAVAWLFHLLMGH